VGYARVSTVQQAEEGISLEAQQEKVQDYCKLRDLELTALFTDAGVSASTPLSQRPGGAKALRALEKDGIGHIVGMKLDRFFRNTMDCLSSISAWDDEGIAFHLVDHGGQTVDTSSSGGKLFITFLAGIAEWERNVISERTVMALQQKIERGDTLGAAPYGKRWDTETHEIVEDPDELERVRHILELRTAGMSIRKIVALLNENGIPARGGQWHVTTIARILKRAQG